MIANEDIELRMCENQVYPIKVLLYILLSFAFDNCFTFVVKKYALSTSDPKIFVNIILVSATVLALLLVLRYILRFNIHVCLKALLFYLIDLHFLYFIYICTKNLHIQRKINKLCTFNSLFILWI